MRSAEIRRTTRETDVFVRVELDGTGKTDVQTGVGFLDHMLTLFAFHGGLDLTVTCTGDTNVDDHHTVEDVGIALGEALLKALGNFSGIARYGSFLLPMDEALALCALDLSGRGTLAFDVRFTAEKIGTFDTQLVEEFFAALTRTLRITLHFKLLAGVNAHHVAEACFKGFGRALRQAVAKTESGTASTKGLLI